MGSGGRQRRRRRRAPEPLGDKVGGRVDGVAPPGRRSEPTDISAANSDRSTASDSSSGSSGGSGDAEEGAARVARVTTAAAAVSAAVSAAAPHPPAPRRPQQHTQAARRFRSYSAEAVALGRGTAAASSAVAELAARRAEVSLLLDALLALHVLDGGHSRKQQQPLSRSPHLDEHAAATGLFSVPSASASSSTYVPNWGDASTTPLDVHAACEFIALFRDVAELAACSPVLRGATLWRLCVVDSIVAASTSQVQRPLVQAVGDLSEGSTMLAARATTIHTSSTLTTHSLRLPSTGGSGSGTDVMHGVVPPALPLLLFVPALAAAFSSPAVQSAVAAVWRAPLLLGEATGAIGTASGGGRSSSSAMGDGRTCAAGVGTAAGVPVRGGLRRVVPSTVIYTGPHLPPAARVSPPLTAAEGEGGGGGGRDDEGTGAAAALPSPAVFIRDAAAALSPSAAPRLSGGGGGGAVDDGSGSGSDFSDDTDGIDVEEEEDRMAAPSALNAAPQGCVAAASVLARLGRPSGLGQAGLVAVRDATLQLFDADELAVGSEDAVVACVMDIICGEGGRVLYMV